MGGRTGSHKKHTSICGVGDSSGEMRSFLSFRDGQLALRFVLRDSQMPFNTRMMKAVCQAKREGLEMN